MDELSLGTQELVLIARALHKQAIILILDEPTAILSQAETDILFRTVHYLKERGTSILYVSHRIPEIARIADRVTVLEGEAELLLPLVAPVRVVPASVGAADLRRAADRVGRRLPQGRQEVERRGRLEPGQGRAVHADPDRLRRPPLRVQQRRRAQQRRDHVALVDHLAGFDVMAQQAAFGRARMRLAAQRNVALNLRRVDGTRRFV